MSDFGEIDPEANIRIADKREITFPKDGQTFADQWHAFSDCPLWPLMSSLCVIRLRNGYTDYMFDQQTMVMTRRQTGELICIYIVCVHKSSQHGQGTAGRNQLRV